MNFFKRLFRKTPTAIPVIAAADEGFLVHLSVMLKSVELHLDEGYQTHAYVFHNGVSTAGRERVEQSLDASKVKLIWMKLSDDILKPFNVQGHVNEMTYFRILAPSELPDEVSKAIYLDSDMVLKESLHELYSIPMNGAEVMACQDVTVPFMNAEAAMDNFAESEPYLSKTVPLAYYSEIGIPPEAPYFNGGLLVIDIEKWKSNKMTEVLINHLIEFKSKNTFWDQDALNAIFWNRCKFIPGEWNQTAHIFRFPTWDTSPLDEESFTTIINRPKLIHFSTRRKPWHEDCDHPLKDEYQLYLEKTAWR